MGGEATCAVGADTVDRRFAPTPMRPPLEHGYTLLLWYIDVHSKDPSISKRWDAPGVGFGRSIGERHMINLAFPSAAREPR